MAEENIKKFLKDYKEETKRHFDVVAEDLKDEIKAVAEGVTTNTEKLEEHDRRFNKIDETLETIKLDIEFIKNELKQKVDRDEFAVLEKKSKLTRDKTLCFYLILLFLSASRQILREIFLFSKNFFTSPSIGEFLFLTNVSNLLNPE